MLKMIKLWIWRADWGWESLGMVKERWWGEEEDENKGVTQVRSLSQGNRSFLTAVVITQICTRDKMA